MEDLNTAKKIAKIISLTALSSAFSVLFTLSIFSYISDFRYVPQYYNMPRDMALLLTALYGVFLIKSIISCISVVMAPIAMTKFQKSHIANPAMSESIKIDTGEVLSTEKEKSNPLSGCMDHTHAIIGYSRKSTLLNLLVFALPAITACALPSILSLDRNLIVASLSVISVVAALTVAVNVYCGLKLSVLEKEMSEKYNLWSPTNPLNDPAESDKLLDNAYLVGTEASQSVGSGKIAATFT